MKVPLFTPTDVANAWHQVIAPGGYEWWHFDAEDTAGELRFVVDFFQGMVFDADYLRAYRRYRRWPTRCKPPLPAAHPCLTLCLYHRDKIVARLSSKYAEDEFTAAAEQLDVRIGPNSVHAQPAGNIGLELQTGAVSAQLRFVPRFKHPPAGIVTPSLYFRQQHWTVVEPLCAVSGQITAAGRRVDFDGLGFHDHQFGVLPLGLGLSRWMTGRVLMNDHSMIFHYRQLGTGAESLYLLEAETLGTRPMVHENISAQWNCRTGLWLRYPSHLQAGPLRLHSPRVLDASFARIQLRYQASVRGVEAVAFCEVVYPARGTFGRNQIPIANHA